jgi:hypothetical protein
MASTDEHVKRLDFDAKAAAKVRSFFNLLLSLLDLCESAC